MSFVTFMAAFVKTGWLGIGYIKGGWWGGWALGALGGNNSGTTGATAPTNAGSQASIR